MDRIRALPALTGIRFVAAFLVLLYHYGASWSERLHIAPLSRFLHNGFLGVSVFFVLSGFILTHVHQDDRLDRAFLVRFYEARFARLYPVYLLALIVALPVLIRPMTPSEAVRVLLMVQSWTVPGSELGWAWILQAWTLSVELFFYLMFPWLLQALRRLDATGMVLCIGGAGALIVLGGLPTAAPGTVMPGIEAYVPLPLLRLPEFVLGMALRRWAELRPRAARSLAGTGAELLALGLLLVSLATAAGIHARGWVAVVTGLLIVQLYEGSGWVSRLLSTRLLQLLGGASYSLYLLQQPIRNHCLRWLGGHGDKFVSPVITIVVAILVFLYWETPVRIRLLAWMQARRAAATVERLA